MIESRDSVGPGALRQLGLSVSNQERTARPKAGRCLCPGALESKLSEAPVHKRQTPHFRAAPFFLIALRGEDENRKPSTTPFVNPCRSAFYCVSLQTGSLTFEHFWAIFGPRFLTRRRHEDQEKCQFQAKGLRKEQ